jgi:sugar-specific transcriptional regulator TrmB
MELILNLMAAGFTEYEAKVYLALLNENPATGYQLSKKAGIPRSMVYEALGRLHARGAVLKSDEQRATFFRPLPPDVLLDRFEREHQDLIQGLRADLRKLYNVQDEDRLWLINGHGPVISYATRMIQNARTELMLIIADPEILASYQRGTRLNVLLTGIEAFPIPIKEQSQSGVEIHIARHPPVESQLQELGPMLLVEADDKECLIARMEAGANAAATVTSNRQLVFIARQFVWMELFTQRIYTQIEPDLLASLTSEDRQILANLPQVVEHGET